MTSIRCLRRDWESGDLDRCLAGAKAFIEREPRKPQGYEYKALSLAALGQEEEALPVFQQAIRLASPRITGMIWRQAARALKVTGGKRETIRSFWVGCNSELEEIFDLSRTYCLEGDKNKAIHCLEKISKNVLGDDVRGLIGKCISILSGGIGLGGELPTLPCRRIQRLVLVSGMGWSGSGALFDYLAEFEEVEAVSGEFPHLTRGKVSLATMFSRIGDREGLREQIINFFYFNLLGLSRIEQPSDLKAFQFGRRCLFGRDYEEYASFLKTFCFLANRLLNERDSRARAELFTDVMVNLVIDKVFVRRGGSIREIVVMDNAVPIQEMDMVRFLDRVTVLCCFRDPRSNYVALIRENPRFTQSVSGYVRRQGERLKKLVESVEEKAEGGWGGKGSSVLKVQFEEFVLSERYRDGLAEELGLDLNKRRKHERFRPWESMRNVVIHEEHPEQGEIRKISQALRRYCYEPAIVPLEG